MGMQYRSHPSGCQPDWRKWVDGCLDALLPPCCLLCRGRGSATGLCADCRSGLPASEHDCPLCALPVPGPGTCGACLQTPPPWDRAAAALVYEFPVDVLVGLLKYHRQLAAGPALADAMAAKPPRQDLDGAVLVPVPLHWTRQAVRGFNQSIELAGLVARSHGLRLSLNGLRRIRRTPAQAGLDAATRRRNLRRAFAWRGAPLHGMHVVLVDDVMTTGSTAAACTSVLREAGAGPVDLWVAARVGKGG